jgi:hypothetical protein
MSGFVSRLLDNIEWKSIPGECLELVVSQEPVFTAFLPMS